MAIADGREPITRSPSVRLSVAPPVPNDSGRRVGNLHRPLRYSRPLRHVFYLSAQTSMMRPGPNRDY
jgi:hypothetical protein